MFKKLVNTLFLKNSIGELDTNNQLGWFLGGFNPKTEYSPGMNGFYHAVDNVDKLNMQITVIANARCNRNSFLLQNIFHVPFGYNQANTGELPDLLITLPSVEIYEKSSNYLESVGYRVIKLDFASEINLCNITSFEELLQTIPEMKKIEIGAKKDYPVAFFIVFPIYNSKLKAALTNVITKLLQQLFDTANRYDSKLYVPVYVMLGEIGYLDKIADLDRMLTTMRSRRIYPMLVWDSLSQLRQIYGDTWEAILGTCDTHIYLGVNDNFSAEVCSKYMENKLFAEEIIRLEANRVIVIQRKRKPSFIYRV